MTIMSIGVLGDTNVNSLLLEKIDSEYFRLPFRKDVFRNLNRFLLCGKSLNFNMVFKENFISFVKFVPTERDDEHVDRFIFTFFG